MKVIDLQLRQFTKKKEEEEEEENEDRNLLPWTAGDKQNCITCHCVEA